MRYNYKVIPLPKPHPAYPKVASAWMPMLSVQLSHGHGRKTPRLEALIDSGAADCVFRADIADYLQLKLEDGIPSTTGGIVEGAKIDVYYHDVKLWVGTGVIQIRAAFSRQISIAALLGRRGFFENFIITFDPSADPPGFDLQRLGRA